MDPIEAEIMAVLKLVNESAPNPFVLLGLDTNAPIEAEALKAAYKRKSLLLHPDRNGARVGAAEAFQHVTSAYQLLMRLYESSNMNKKRKREDPAPRKPPPRDAAYSNYDALCTALLRQLDASINVSDDSGRAQKRARLETSPSGHLPVLTPSLPTTLPTALPATLPSTLPPLKPPQVKPVTPLPHSTPTPTKAPPPKGEFIHSSDLLAFLSSESYSRRVRGLSRPGCRARGGHSTSTYF